MFMVDDVLLLPVRGLFYVLREIREAAAEEVRRQEEAVRRELSELYMALERREITEEQFGAREEELLALLDDGSSQGTETGPSFRREKRQGGDDGKEAA